jgi:hypothetical protein
MKRVISMIILLMGVLVGTAQITITTEGLGRVEWSEEDGEFNKNRKWIEDNVSKFWFNKAETVLVHTTTTMESTYYVNGTDHVEEDDLFIYYATSDVGNKYVFYFDIGHLEVRTMAWDGSYLLYTLIKGIFED